MGCGSSTATEVQNSTTIPKSEAIGRSNFESQVSSNVTNVPNVSVGGSSNSNSNNKNVGGPPMNNNNSNIENNGNNNENTQKKKRKKKSNVLSDKAKDIVTETTPLVAKNLFGITSEFYPMMFADHPITVSFFNQSNQRTLSQPKALTDAIFKSVVHMENLKEIQYDVDTIAHKHCALRVPADSYKIVHDCFLAAVVRVLGKDVVTDDIASSWSEVLVAVSKHFIARERELYDIAEKRRGGWHALNDGPRDFTVSKVIEHDGGLVATLYLEPCDRSQEIPEFTPGQYITVTDIPDGAPENLAPRHFTISHHKDFRITVRAIEARNDSPAGVMSTYLVSRKEGDVISISPPFGNYVLKDAPPSQIDATVFVSGGIGVTPAIALALPAVEQGRNVIALHMGDTTDLFDEIANAIKRSGKGVAHKGRREIMREIVERVEGAGFDPKRCHYYISGHIAMIDSIAALLVRSGVDMECINYEGFGPHSRLSIEDVGACPLEVNKN